MLKEKLIKWYLFLPVRKVKKVIILLNSITEKLTGFNIDTIKVTDYNAAVEAMRAGRAHIAWYGGKTYVKAAEIANAEALQLE